jgi:hypothetical protein
MELLIERLTTAWNDGVLIQSNDLDKRIKKLEDKYKEQ